MTGGACLGQGVGAIARPGGDGAVNAWLAAHFVSREVTAVATRPGGISHLVSVNTNQIRSATRAGESGMDLFSRILES